MSWRSDPAGYGTSFAQHYWPTAITPLSMALSHLGPGIFLATIPVYRNLTAVTGKLLDAWGEWSCPGFTEKMQRRREEQKRKPQQPQQPQKANEFLGEHNWWN